MRSGKPFNPGQPKQIQARINERRALSLRVEGMSYDEIADQLNISQPTAHATVMRVLKKNLEDCKENIPEARRIELERCDKLLTFVWKRCQAGDTRAIESALKIAKRRAELEGLDAPVNVKASSEGGAILIEVFRKMIDDATTEEVQ